MNDPRDRDAAIDRALRGAARAPSGGAGPTDACLDAETVAAWMDGGLAGPALEVARAHTAGCARCQALVGALVRSAPAGQPAAGRQPARRWWGWLVPVAAAAAAVALWVIVPRGPGVVPSASEVAREAAAPPAGGDREAAASAPLQAAARPPASAEAHNEAKTGTSNTTPPAARKAGSQSGTATGATGAAGVSTRAKALDALSATPATQPAAKPVPLPPPPAAAAPPPARPAAGAVAGALARPQAAERLTSVSAAPPVAVEVLAPDPAIRWRLVGASVEQSTDAGSSWHAVFTGATGDPVLTAGSAPSASVCWLVGKRGMVLRSTDGRTFQRVVFPEATDLSAVTAVDDQRATVTAVDGRQFRTTDGGRTWVAGAVQDF